MFLQLHQRLADGNAADTKLTRNLALVQPIARTIAARHNGISQPVENMRFESRGSAQLWCSSGGDGGIASHGPILIHLRFRTVYHTMAPPQPPAQFALDLGQAEYNIHLC